MTEAYRTSIIFEDGHEIRDEHSSIENAINHLKWHDEEFPNEKFKKMEIIRLYSKMEINLH